MAIDSPTGIVTGACVAPIIGCGVAQHAGSSARSPGPQQACGAEEGDAGFIKQKAGATRRRDAINRTVHPSTRPRSPDVRSDDGPPEACATDAMSAHRRPRINPRPPNLQRDKTRDHGGEWAARDCSRCNAAITAGGAVLGPAES